MAETSLIQTIPKKYDAFPTLRSMMADILKPALCFDVLSSTSWTVMLCQRQALEDLGLNGTQYNTCVRSLLGHCFQFTRHCRADSNLDNVYTLYTLPTYVFASAMYANIGLSAGVVILAWVMRPILMRENKKLRE
ncbi:hypothetical protein P175DRAFT_0531367 [Aspergillus ochraceoroseus IBT 24754]|uniref:Uncharacterized protein n=1 Tax=Aspergillus ochraceoroseus IBT 24754 TaxID=1392256 RepID=A0A2T5LZX3_9EURO|nr:uncharacterized protein P175DRAFT_0531367 [Aspergillus ochraceoroseus IBT 24754]PTU21834.1 hypothetical protein P175DRAFT_0531367 [Aspergillus ochraceoroseus IBT 24754]